MLMSTKKAIQHKICLELNQLCRMGSNFTHPACSRPTLKKSSLLAFPRGDAANTLLNFSTLEKADPGTVLALSTNYGSFEEITNEEK
uniref:Uncharacterized protein n=1 Tax=Romanomermis culicivorax TaxID=13658 RepID=A0A915I401_ROMCU